jgi:hypothetical protein
MHTMNTAQQTNSTFGTESCNAILAVAIETRHGKGRDGWQARTDIALGHERMLRLSTGKGRNGIATHAQVWRMEGMAMSFEMFGDFSKVIANESKRCTEKSVAQLHAYVLDTSLGAVVAQVITHYSAKPAPFDPLVARGMADEFLAGRVSGLSCFAARAVADSVARGDQ